MAELKKFLKMVQEIEEITHGIILSENDVAAQLGQKYNMESLRLSYPDPQNKPFSIDEIQSIIQCLLDGEQALNDLLLFIDHRNILLSIKDIRNAITKSLEEKNKCVISLSMLNDHACQFKSYYTFLDCKILEFNQASDNNGFIGAITCSLKNEETISITVKSKTDGCRLVVHKKTISFYSDILFQIIPYDSSGPQYKRFVEFMVSGDIHEQEIILNIERLKGFICILIEPSRNGEYDTIEAFSPQNAGWVLDEGTNEILDSRSGKKIQGRQQMLPTVSFNGSLCMSNLDFFRMNRVQYNYSPVILKDTCIVTDYIDYFYCSSQRLNRR